MKDENGKEIPNDEMQEVLANAKKVANSETKNENIQETDDQKAEKIKTAETEKALKEKEKEEQELAEKEKNLEGKDKKTEGKKKEFWEIEELEGEKDEKTDYKSLFEDTVEQLAAEKLKVEKYEKNYIIKDLAEFLDDPDFDVEKWMDSMKPKDIKNLSTEDLFKLNLKNQNADFTDDELDREWIKKEKEIKDASEDETDISLANKKLKNSLIKELTPKVDLTKESDYLKTYKTKKQELIANANQNKENVVKAAKAAKEYLNSLEGELIQGLPITKEDIEKADKAIFDANYYNTKDGVYNHKKRVNDTLLIIKFKDVITTLLKARESEIKEEQVNANADSKSGNLKIEKVKKTDEEAAKNYVESQL